MPSDPSSPGRPAVLPSFLLGMLLVLQGCGLLTGDGPAGTSSGGSANDGAASGGSSGSGAAGCTDLSESACGISPDCEPYVGYRVDELSACYEGTPEYLGCHHFSLACDPVVLVAEDEAGHAWHLPSGCVPPTFEEETPSSYGACAPDGAGGLGGAGANEGTCFCSVK